MQTNNIIWKIKTKININTINQMLMPTKTEKEITT